MRTGFDKAIDPKYAHIERERRWLVDAERRPGLGGLPFIGIEDRYITGTRLRLRRMTDSTTGAISLKLTKKYAADDPLARPIVTTYLTAPEYTVLEALPATPLSKERYKIACDGIAFSLDRFIGPLAPLELAEIEWPDDAGLRALRPPDWAIRDVSGDARYQGGALSASDFCED